MRDIDIVLPSYARCCTQKKFFDVFFDGLMKSNDVRSMLQHVGEAQQKKVLRVGISYIIMFVDGWSVGKFAMEHLAYTHGRHGMNINPLYYNLWVDALLHSVAMHDVEFDSRTERAWRSVIGAGIKKLSSSSSVAMRAY